MASVHAQGRRRNQPTPAVARAVRNDQQKHSGFRSEWSELAVGARVQPPYLIHHRSLPDQGRPSK